MTFAIKPGDYFSPTVGLIFISTIRQTQKPINITAAKIRMQIYCDGNHKLSTNR